MTISSAIRMLNRLRLLCILAYAAPLLFHTCQGYYVLRYVHSNKKQRVRVINQSLEPSVIPNVPSHDRYMERESALSPLALPAGLPFYAKSFSFKRRDFISFVLPSLTMLATSTPSNALTPSEAEEQYDIYAASYDQLDGGTASSLLGIAEARTSLIQKSRGHVLEIGVGTGLNLDKYEGQQLESLTLVDISDGMLQVAAARIPNLPNLKGVPIKIIKADATSDLVDLFGTDAFTTVVDSFSLCVMGKEGAKNCLEQLSRVVKQPSDGGVVLLLENSRSSNPVLGLYQDATADIAASAGGKGCAYNQDVPALIQSTKRLQIASETRYAAGLFRSFECQKNG